MNGRKDQIFLKSQKFGLYWNTWKTPDAPCFQSWTVPVSHEKDAAMGSTSSEVFIHHKMERIKGILGAPTSGSIADLIAMHHAWT